MPPKAAAPISARVARERAWALEAWTARLSWGAMRRLANLPESEGGLGYDLSESALKGLVLKAREDRGDVTMGRDERRERQSVEVDMRARAARNDLDAAYDRARVLDRAIDDFEVYDADTADALARLVAERRELAKVIEAADRRLDAAQAREAKLHGLDAPAEARLEVTHRDAVVDELNAMLERAGHKPIAAPAE
ncbi:MAG: hypothetical protein M3Y29_06390 [Chloroflexota bacterium]|nr:hypothetical protein [Chloroflexota bacterium]